jgi:hypothetical protein
MTWLAFKFGIKKVWVWFKKYGYLVALAMAAAVIFLLKGRNGLEAIKESFAASDKRAEDEHAILKESHEREVKRVADYFELEKELKETHGIRTADIKVKMKEAVKKNEGKTIEELAKEIADALGAEVIHPNG